MPQVEAGACTKPVISIKAMGMLDTLVDGETAFVANIAQEIIVNVDDIANYLMALMTDSALREKMGGAGRVSRKILITVLWPNGLYRSSMKDQGSNRRCDL
jgi:glycosyltransferase involved in cell wall biosynthesis